MVPGSWYRRAGWRVGISFESRATQRWQRNADSHLTRYLARELGDRQIRANVIAPGAIATDFAGGVVRDVPDVNRHVAGMISLGRVGLPDDVGTAAAALLSNGMNWMNGTRVEISGGQNL